jgi:hypothetical protein
MDSHISNKQHQPQYHSAPDTHTSLLPTTPSPRQSSYYNIQHQPIGQQHTDTDLRYQYLPPLSPSTRDHHTNINSYPASSILTQLAAIIVQVTSIHPQGNNRASNQLSPSIPAKNPYTPITNRMSPIICPRAPQSTESSLIATIPLTTSASMPSMSYPPS